jgi:hypothetical protein
MSRVLLALACALTAFAESSHHNADEDMIRNRLATYTQARNHGDAHAESLAMPKMGTSEPGAQPVVGALKSKRHWLYRCELTNLR